MDLCHRFIRTGRDDGAGGQRVIALVPGLPNACEGKRRLLGAVDIPRQPVAGVVFCPFIKPGRRDQASAGAARVPEGGLFSKCFGARVDQKRSVRWRFVPMGQKPPSHRAETALAFVGGYGVDMGCWADVKIWSVRQIIGRGGLEKGSHGVIWKCNSKASTHGSVLRKKNGFPWFGCLQMLGIAKEFQNDVAHLTPRAKGQMVDENVNGRLETIKVLN